MAARCARSRKVWPGRFLCENINNTIYNTMQTLEFCICLPPQQCKFWLPLLSLNGKNRQTNFVLRCCTRGAEGLYPVSLIGLPAMQHPHSGRKFYIRPCQVSFVCLHDHLCTHMGPATRFELRCKGLHKVLSTRVNFWWSGAYTKRVWKQAL